MPDTDLISSKQKLWAVSYVRVSSNAQVKKGQGAESQAARCAEYARHKGYDIIKVFEDKAVSGSLVDRPGMKALIAFLKKHKQRRVRVIIDDISRLARGMEAHLALRAAISEAGGQLESPSIEFGTDSDSQLIEHLLASVSAHARTKNAEQVRARMEGRLLNGYYTFAAPWGYKYQKQEGGGNLLVRDEPVASYIQEAFEGLASGRFQSKTEVARFLTSCPEFKKGSNGQVHTSRVENMLPRVLYGGMIERPDWGISLRPGKHEGLVSFETFLKANERVNGKAYAPARADLSEDFPLRGAVRCASCGHSMTANWSTSKSGKRHAYYLCFKKGCSDYRKSIKRAEIEGAFEDLLKSLAPAPSFKELITAMFKDAWTMQQARISAALKSVTEKIKAIEGEMDGLVDRLLKTSNERVVRACENRIDVLERDKAAMQEKLGQSGKPKRSFEEVFELTLGFLSNPWNL